MDVLKHHTGVCTKCEDEITEFNLNSFSVVTLDIQNYSTYSMLISNQNCTSFKNLSAACTVELTSMP